MLFQKDKQTGKWAEVNLYCSAKSRMSDAFVDILVKYIRAHPDEFMEVHMESGPSFLEVVFDMDTPAMREHKAKMDEWMAGVGIVTEPVDFTLEHKTDSYIVIDSIG